jgi:hypothetical protein
VKKIQLTKVILMALGAKHPWKISGYGFLMTGGGRFSTRGHKRRSKEKRGIETIPTINRVQELLRDYPVGDLKKGQEQGETDADSLVFVPDRIRSDGENDYSKGVRLKFDQHIRFSAKGGYECRGWRVRPLHIPSVKVTPTTESPEKTREDETQIR